LLTLKDMAGEIYVPSKAASTDVDKLKGAFVSKDVSVNIVPFVLSSLS